MTIYQFHGTQEFTWGDGMGREVVFRATSRDMAILAQRIEEAADLEDGVIQAWRLVDIFPGQPEMHTTMHIGRALRAIGCDEE